jgi:hypothetical protein
MVEWEADLAVDLHEGRETLNSPMEVALYLIKSYKKDLGIANVGTIQISQYHVKNQAPPLSLSRIF